MSETLKRIQELGSKGLVKVSDHGYDEAASDLIRIKDIVGGLPDAVLVEDDPDYPKGSCVLVLQTVEGSASIHVVWGIPKGANSPAVLITAYRPDPDRWTEDFLRRKE